MRCAWEGGGGFRGAWHEWCGWERGDGRDFGYRISDIGWRDGREGKGLRFRRGGGGVSTGRGERWGECLAGSGICWDRFEKLFHASVAFMSRAPGQ